MNPKASSIIIFLSLLCLFSSATEAFDITKILNNYTDFSTFNTLLSQTGLAQQINSRQTITVLVVSNGAAGSLSGKPLDITKRILSTHIILDYYDQEKLSKLQQKSTILTTLYQTTGIANDQKGFLNVTRTPDRNIMFGSAVKGAPLSASLVGAVTSQPYNVSVLQVSGIIEVPGIENSAPPSPPTPATAAPKKAPAPSKAASPSKAPAHEADAPSSSPPEPDTMPADAVPDPAPKNSGSSRVVGGGLAVVVFALVASVLGF